MVALNTDFAASKPATDAKNRVGRFFSLAAESAGKDSRSSLKYAGEKRNCRYDFVSVDTEFEYGPFGELIRSTGEKKEDFNFRYSTKYEDTETGLLYYGYRYYNAETGRWLNRDPVEEQGGLNLYGFVDNDSINYVDDLGHNKKGYTGPVPKDQQSPNTYPKPPTPAPTTPSNLTSGSTRANKTGNAAVDALDTISQQVPAAATWAFRRLGIKRCNAQRVKGNDNCYCCVITMYVVTTNSLFLPSSSVVHFGSARVVEGSCLDNKNADDYITNTSGWLTPSFIKNVKRESQEMVKYYEPW